MKRPRVHDPFEHAKFLGRISNLPINGDFEDGYGETPAEVAATIEAAIDAGLAGIGIEDTSANPQAPVRDFDEAVSRIRTAAKAARGRIVLTARTDNFIQGRPDLDDTLKRLTAFAKEGADVLYAPFPPDLASVVKIVQAVAPKPVNVVIGPADKTLTVAELQAVGVKRISLGSGLYQHSMASLRDAAEALRKGDLAAASAGMPFRELVGYLKKAQAGPDSAGD